MKVFFRHSLINVTLVATAIATFATSYTAQAQANTIVIKGNAFIDANENGKRDAGERSLFARYKITNGGSFNKCQATAGDGSYGFGLNSPGTYFVMPIASAGYHTTTPVVKIDAKSTGQTYVADLPFALSTLAAAENCGDYEPKRTARVPWALVETSQARGLSTFISAVNKAGLFETLSGSGPYTLFVPSDLAFAKISESDLNAILNNKAQLMALLSNHVVRGRVSANDVANSTSLPTLGGRELAIRTDDEGEVYVNDARITSTDISAANGVIHVIDTVLIP